MGRKHIPGEDCVFKHNWPASQSASTIDQVKRIFLDKLKKKKEKKGEWLQKCYRWSSYTY